MLVLARKLDEVICIGDDITVKVVGIQKGVVRLGIIAPKNVNVDREEIYEERKAVYGCEDSDQSEFDY